MKTCMQTFRVNIDGLLTFLTNTEHETALIGLLLPRQDVLENQEKQLLSQIATAHTDRKRYIYCVAIVSLYGILERFVEKLIEAFVDRIAGSVSSYQMMPEAIKKNHVLMSLNLAKAIVEERHRTGTTHEDIIANLHSCLSCAPSFRLNGAAFVVHRGNLTLTKVTNFLSSIGIENHLRRVTMTRKLLDFFNQREPERDIRHVADQDLSALLQPIDDLVERRNQVSHGIIDDIESTDLLKERCHFVTAYGGALYDTMLQELLKYQVQLAGVQALDKPIAVYNNSIVCFENDNCRIAVGNILAAATGDALSPFRYSPIISLEINHESLTQITISEPTKFGAKVSFKASESYDYFVLPDGMV